MFDETRLIGLMTAAQDAEKGADARLGRQDRRAQGAFFTPESLVEQVVETTLAPLVEGAPRGRVPDLVVLDPACGDGRFLAAAARWLEQRLSLGQEGMAEMSERCLLGMERDPEFAALARRQVPGARIVNAEALLGGTEIGPVDAVLGNPPYLRSIHLGESDGALREALRGRYASTSHGEWDLYAAFLEQGFDWIRGHGQLGFVVPSRWLSAQSARELRRKLAEHRALRGVIDFGAEQIFSGATTYISAIFLSGSPVARAQVASFRARSWSFGTIPCAELGASPWRLTVAEGRRALSSMEESPDRLQRNRKIVKGAGTNCDRVYVFDRGSARGALVRVFSRALGEDVLLEASALRRCYRGRDIKAPHQDAPGALALVPYHSDGILWSPDYLASTFPRVHAYLHRCRPLLDKRERGRFAGDTFYCYGRPQNLRLLLSDRPRVLIPDVAKGGRALADHRGAFALDSAYAVFPDDIEEVDALAVVLASERVRFWLGERGVLLRGGYVRMKTAFLRELPVPDLEVLGKALELSPANWEELVARAYGQPSLRASEVVAQDSIGDQLG